VEISTSEVSYAKKNSMGYAKKEEKISMPKGMREKEKKCMPKRMKKRKEKERKKEIKIAHTFK
jgi:hypothetical protein